MVQRYDCRGAVVTHENGPFVEYEDYAALEAKYLELAGWVLDAPCDHTTEGLAKEALGK